MDFDNQTSTTHCWLYDNLPDLRTEDPDVMHHYTAWIKHLVSEYSIDGLRIDSARHVDKKSLKQLCEAAGVYCLAEVADGDPSYAYPYQNVLDGGGIIDYPLYFPFNRTFTYSGASSMQDLAYAVWLNTNESLDSTLHGVWTENHDNPRIASHNTDLSIAKNALAWTVLMEGIPIVYQGQEQHLDGGDDPYCREAMWLDENGGMDRTAPLYKYARHLNRIRRWAITYSRFATKKTGVLNYNDSQIALRRGVVRWILTYAGVGQSSGEFKVENAGFKKGMPRITVSAHS